MVRPVNKKVRPNSWKIDARKFIQKVWKPYSKGCVFLGTKCRKTNSWKEHYFETPVAKTELKDFFNDYNRKEYDLYFCPNAFRSTERKKENALDTPYAWVDIDGADSNGFEPKPNVSWSTFPKNTQGLWIFPDQIPATEAELYSKCLAYNHGADKNGWSCTKYLRIPETYNPKPKYDRPKVKLFAVDWKPQARGLVAISRADFIKSNAPIIHLHKDYKTPRNVRKLVRKYKRKGLEDRAGYLAGCKNMAWGGSDRSKAIYEINCGLDDVGALPDEIVVVLYLNPYFISKYGKDISKAHIEVTRVLAKRRAAS